MEANTLKFINDSRAFRGEKPLLEENNRSNYMLSATVIFLVIFVTGCAVVNNTQPMVIKRQQTTEEPK